MENKLLRRLLASKQMEKTREPTVQAPTSNSRSSSISRTSSRKRKRTSFERDHEVERGQNEPVRMNNRSEASTSRSRSSSVSMASTSRKRQRSSAERNQNREMNNNPLNTLARMLMSDTALTVREGRPMQGYVKKQKYVSLKDKYNNLVADYAALQRRFRQTLDCLGSLADSGVESDINEEHNDEVPNNNENVLEKENQVVPERNDEETPENVEGAVSENNDEEVNENDEEMPENNDQASEGNEQEQDGESEEETDDIIINTDAYVSDIQWRILLRSQSVRLFVENTLQIIFDRKELLNSTVPSHNGNASSADNVFNRMKMKVLRVLLDRYLEERRHEISDEEKETGRREWMNHNFQTTSVTITNTTEMSRYVLYTNTT